MASTSISSTSARAHPNAVPLIVAHGWPGSVFEQIKLIDPLTDPTTVWRPSGRRVRRRDSFAARLRLLVATDRSRLGPGPHRQCIGRTHEAAGIYALRRAGRRLGCGYRPGDGAAGTCGIARHPHQLAGSDNARSRCGRSAATAAVAALSEKERAAVKDLGAFLQQRRPIVSGDDGRAAAGRRLWPDRFTGRPRGLDAGARRVRQVDVRQGSQAIADARRRAGQLHAVLADEHARPRRRESIGRTADKT